MNKLAFAAVTTLPGMGPGSGAGAVAGGGNRAGAAGAVTSGGNRLGAGGSDNTPSARFTSFCFFWKN